MTEQERIEKEFLKLELNKHTVHIYTVRTALLKAVQKSLHEFSGTLLDVGCGKMPYREMICQNNPKVERYIGLDLAESSIHNTSVADLHWDGKTIPLTDESVSSAMATEVLEHVFDPQETLSEIFRVLQPGGTFFFTVPFIWPLHEVPYDAYRYTPFALKYHLEKAGFEGIFIHPLGGWHASLAQMLGLWVTESGLTGRKKKWATKAILKIIPTLLKWDSSDNHFNQHSMNTGYYGIAKKQVL
jgi:SAM-dependent methyltransferase